MPNPIAAHPLFFDCNISFNKFVAILHTGECVMSLNLRKNLHTFPSDVCGQETEWKDRHCTAWASNMQLTATLVISVYTIKIHNNLGNQIHHFTVICPHTAHKPTQITAVALCHKKAGDPCCTATMIQLLHSKNTFNDL
jgi:hypothetical protein